MLALSLIVISLMDVSKTSDTNNLLVAEMSKIRLSATTIIYKSFVMQYVVPEPFED